MSKRAQKLLLAGIFIVSSLFSNDGKAGTWMRTSSGTQIRHSSLPLLNLSGNPTNRSGLSQDAFFGLVSNSLNRWKQATGSAVQFNYWQGPYTTNSDYNGESNIYFTSQESGSSGVDGSTLAVTQVWHYTSTGQIIETDIELNDVNFTFTDNVLDSSHTSGRYVYLGNILTHELGHALGLSHSGNLQASMLFVESSQQARVSCDDLQTFHEGYSIRTSLLGTIRGRVLSPSNAPLLGVQISAVSIKRGTVIGTTLTNADGTFSLGGLDPGNYRLLFEPYYAGPSPLSDYYSGMAGQICSNGRFFSRSFSNGSYTVNAAQSTNSGDYSLQCASSGEGAVVSPISGGAALNSAIPLNDFVADSVSTGATTRKYYNIGIISGAQRISALNFSLYSPMSSTLRLLDSQGRAVGSTYWTTAQPAFQGDSGYQNADSFLQTMNLPADQYYLEVTSHSNTSNYYPAGFLSLDTTGFVALTISATSPSAWDATVFGTNPRCELVDSFSPYQSPSSPAPTRDISPPKQTVPAAGFCATIQNDHNGPIPPGAILGWMFPFFFVTGLHLLRKRGHSIHY